jgi:hypothetical protein
LHVAAIRTLGWSTLDCFKPLFVIVQLAEQLQQGSLYDKIARDFDQTESTAAEHARKQ